MKTRNKTIKVVFIEVTVDEHTEIKKRAAMRNVTMKQYIMQAIEDRIKKESKYD